MLLTIFSSHGSGAVQFLDFHRKGGGRAEGW